MTPYYADDWVTLYHGDCVTVVEAVHPQADLIVTDPPYGETPLPWDKWPPGWPTSISDVAKAMWCFGTVRMFTDHWGDFVFWRMSQDLIWRKPDASHWVTDRFRRVHEHVLHFYRGRWEDVRHETPRDVYYGGTLGRRMRQSDKRDAQHGALRAGMEYIDDGTRLALSVLDVASPRGNMLHPTQKPVGILTPLIAYGCPPGGTVFDPFAGSGSTGEAARLSGRHAILVEADERYCEQTAQRFAQGFFEDVT